MVRFRTWWKTRCFLHHDYPKLPRGWISRYQAITLYQAALNHSGPLLEVGSWIGRSTCCLAAGVRDSGAQKVLVTVDLGISSPEEWQQFFGAPVDRKPDKERYLDVITQEGGSMAVLQENLVERGLDRWVTVRKGDFRDMDCSPFGLIFCDATHNLREIAANGPTLNRLLRPGGTLIADDIRTDEMRQALLTWVPCRSHSLREGLFIGRKQA